MDSGPGFGSTVPVSVPAPTPLSSTLPSPHPSNPSNPAHHHHAPVAASATGPCPVTHSPAPAPAAPAASDHHRHHNHFAEGAINPSMASAAPSSPSGGHPLPDGPLYTHNGRLDASVAGSHAASATPFSSHGTSAAAAVSQNGQTKDVVGWCEY